MTKKTVKTVKSQSLRKEGQKYIYNKIDCL